MKVTFQVSLYPIAQKDFKQPINDFINGLREKGLDARVHETSTICSGDIDAAFDALKKGYMSAAESGDVVMVVTVVNGAPSKEELNELNR